MDTTITETSQDSDNIFSQFIGKYVIVRGKEAGILAGVLQAARGGMCVLSEARRFWYYGFVSATVDFLSSIALHGPRSELKLGETLLSIALTEIYEIIPCSPEAEARIREYKTHAK